MKSLGSPWLWAGNLSEYSDRTEPQHKDTNPTDPAKREDNQARPKQNDGARRRDRSHPGEVQCVKVLAEPIAPIVGDEKKAVVAIVQGGAEDQTFEIADIGKIKIFFPQKSFIEWGETRPFQFGEGGGVGRSVEVEAVNAIPDTRSGAT